MLANVRMQYNTPLALAQLAPCGDGTILKLILFYCILPFLLVVLQWVALSWERSTLSANRSKFQTAPCYSPFGSVVFTVNCVMQSIM